jgi:hypothetical protein
VREKTSRAFSPLIPLLSPLETQILMWCSNTLNLARIRSIVKVSSFPHYKELRDFDFEFQTSIKPEIRDFETLRFLEAAENIVFLGSSGVGENTSGHFHRYNCRQEAIQHLLHKVP